MANRLFPVRHVPRSTQLWHELEGESLPWPHAPRFGWECLISHLDLVGEHATQRIVLTIDSADFVTGRARAVITGGGLVSPVTVTADAAVADDEEDATAALAAAITALIPTTLAGVIVSAAEAANTVAINCVPGIGRVSIDFTYEPAQQISVTWGGTLVDGEYSVTISAGQGFDDVTIPNNRAGGSPANAAAMAAAFETTAEGLIATTLADVLARVTTEADAVWWRVMITDSPTRFTAEGVEWEMGGGVPWARLRGWAHPTPAEALAALVEADAVPEHWLDAARAPRWWCDACDGTALLSASLFCRGTHEAPPSHAALVAVASLGVDTLARAEAIVAETWPGRALAWRPMTAAALQKHHADHCAGLDVTPALVFSREMTPPLTNFEWRPAWPEVCPYGGLFGTPDDDRHGVHRAWPALRALAALGLHLVALDASRVVIAVETLA